VLLFYLLIVFIYNVNSCITYIIYYTGGKAVPITDRPRLKFRSMQCVYGQLLLFCCAIMHSDVVLETKVLVSRRLEDKQ